MIFILFLLGAWASNAYAQGQLQVEAPFIPVACLSSFINFSGGQSPYSLSILDAGTRNTLGSFTVTQSPYLWSIPNAAGRQLLFRIEDATGANAESDVFIVQEDTHFTCTNNFPGETTATSSSISASGISSTSNSNTFSSPSQSELLQRSSSSSSTSSTTTATSSFSTGSIKPKVPLFVIIPIVTFVVIMIIFVVRWIQIRKYRRALLDITVITESGEHGYIGNNNKFEWVQDTGRRPSVQYSSTEGGGFAYYAESNTSSATPRIHSPPISSYPPSNYNPFVAPVVPIQAQREDQVSSSMVMPSPIPPVQPLDDAPPPQYQDHATSSSSTAARYNPSSQSYPPKAEYHPTTASSPYTTTEKTQDAISWFASRHRDLITVEIEDRLRRANYRPSDDPREISAEHWKSSCGIDHFELKRLQEAYDRDAIAATKAKSGQVDYLF